MKILREYGPYKWEYETKPEYSIFVNGGKYYGNAKYEITLVQGFDQFDDGQKEAIVQLIYALENAGVFDAKNDLSTFTLDNWTKPMAGGDISQPPYNQPWITYGPGNTVLCSNKIQACCKNNDSGTTELGKHD